jgi:hypothetical protein
MLRSTFASILLTAASATLFAACAGRPPNDSVPEDAAPPSTSSPHDAPGTAPPASAADPRDAGDVMACQSDADCIVVEMGCCDHCNGGFLLSVNKTQVDAARAAHGEKDCTGVACTERGCSFDPQPLCTNRQCSRTERRVDRATGADKRVEIPNRLR